MAYASLGLLSFGASKERNAVWERLLDPTREQLDQCLLARSDHEDHYQAFNVAKSVARFSFGLSKKDDTGKVIDRFVERIEANSSSGFLMTLQKVKAGFMMFMVSCPLFLFVRLFSYMQMFI